MDCRRYGGIMIELARRRMMMGGKKYIPIEYVKYDKLTSGLNIPIPAKGFLTWKMACVQYNTNLNDLIYAGSSGARYYLYCGSERTMRVNNGSSFYDVGSVNGTPVTQTMVSYNVSGAPAASETIRMLGGNNAQSIPYYVMVYNNNRILIHHIEIVRFKSDAYFHDIVDDALYPIIGTNIILGPDK